MKALLRLAGGGVRAVGLSGCGGHQERAPTRQSFNPFEKTLNADSVTGLREAFRVRLVDGAGPPVVTCPSIWSANAGSSVDGGLAVEGGRLYAGAHSALVGYRPSSG